MLFAIVNRRKAINLCIGIMTESRYVTKGQILLQKKNSVILLHIDQIFGIKHSTLKHPHKRLSYETGSVA